MEIIARHEQTRTLKSILESKNPEFTAIYGRRRVGKTFLVHNSIAKYKRDTDVYINITGSRKQDGQPQDLSGLLSNFRVSVVEATGLDPDPQEPSDIFIYLTKLCKNLKQANRRLIIFLDEFPWLCEVEAPGFDFYESFSHLWNNVLEKYGVKVFICGSAASWMLKNIVYPADGLAKRVTNKIKLTAFKLSETKSYLKHKGINYSNVSILELQMLLGGIPFYLNTLQSDLSLQENIFNLILKKGGLLSGKNEYDNLFNHLFSDPDYYREVVAMISKKRGGLSIPEISLKMSHNKSKQASKKLTEALNVLSESDILAKRVQFANKTKGIHYFLIDEYIRFYNRLTTSELGPPQSYAAYHNLLDSQGFKSWQGFNFELLVYKHHKDLIRSLGLEGISVSPHIFYSYKDKNNNLACQIDLLLDRSDRCITICESKLYLSEYEMNKLEYEKLLIRKQCLEQHIKSKRLKSRDFNFCIIHLNGVKRNKYIDLLNPRLVSVEEFI